MYKVEMEPLEPNHTSFGHSSTGIAIFCHDENSAADIFTVSYEDTRTYIVISFSHFAGDFQAVKTYPHLYFSKFYIGVIFR